MFFFFSKLLVIFSSISIILLLVELLVELLSLLLKDLLDLILNFSLLELVGIVKLDLNFKKSIPLSKVVYVLLLVE